MRRSLPFLAGTVVAIYGPMILVHSLVLFGVGWAIAGVELFVLVPLVAMAGIVVAVPFLAFARLREGAGALVLVFGGMVLAFVPAMLLSAKMRMLGFHLAANRARPLVAAIRAYETRHGAPPQTIDALVPEFLPRLPDRLPDLEIITGEKARANYAGNEWVLFAIVSTGVLNWDQFMYFPNQRYPEVGHGGWVERVDDWAYVHE